MDGILNFLKILFLGKAILLTPAPIDIGNQWQNIPLKDPLEVVTSGAQLEIRISRSDKIFKTAKGFNGHYEIADKIFPEGTVQARLSKMNGEPMLLSRRVIAISNDYVAIGVVGNKPFSTEDRFDKVSIRSGIELTGVNVFWKNYKH